MKKLCSRCGLLAMWLAPLGPVVLYGQGDLATVTGLVTDSSKAIVVGATVTIRNTDTNIAKTGSTNGSGLFTVLNLAPGPYDLTASKSGFATYRETKIVLQTGQQLRTDIRLTVGSVAQTVDVTADAAPLNTENGASKGVVVTLQEIQDVPLDGRTVTDIALLVPGVVPNAEGATNGSMSVNGARADNTNFYVDGFSDRNARDAGLQLAPNLDTLQEFKMETSGFSAKYGKNAGGVMNMVLKSGTNQMHGTFFEYFRNTHLDARGFFDPALQPLHRNQFGAVLNGPLVIPKLYNGHDKTFFMVSYEGYRDAEGQSRLARVPTALQRAGDFSQTKKSNGKPLTITNPFANNTPFPGGVIPASLFDPVAVNLTKWFPLPDYTGAGYNYQAIASSYQDWDSFLGKVDHRFSDKDTLSARYSHRADIQPQMWAGSNLGEFPGLQQNNTSLAGITWTHIFSPTVISEARAGFSAMMGGSNIDNSLGQPTAAQLGIAGSTTDATKAGFPEITFANYATLGYDNGWPFQYHMIDYQIGDDLTWIKGKHTLQFGIGSSSNQFNEPNYKNSRGILGASGVWTGAGTFGNGDSYADLMLGLLDGTSINTSPTNSYLRWRDYGFYLNDDFKVSPRLTLNLGLRYEIDPPAHDKYGRMMNFVPSIGKIVVPNDQSVPNLNQLLQQTGLTGLVATAGQYGLPSNLVHTNYKNFGPRFGFAWHASGKTVLRGGYGWFYAGALMENIRVYLAGQFPFGLGYAFTRDLSNTQLMTLENPFPTSIAKISGATNGALTSAGYQTDAPSAYMQNYNLTLERDIGHGDVLEIGYVGSKGTHLGRSYNVNQPYYSISNYMTYGAPPPSPFPGLSTISYWEFGSNSIYNAGQVVFRRRGTGGFFYRLSYSYSKSIDNASQFGTGASTGGYAGAIDSRNLALERGRSDFDRGHVFNAMFSYMLPVGRGKALLGNSGGVVNALFGGWQLASTVTAASGQPFTVGNSIANAGLGISNRPNRLQSGKDITGSGKRGLDYPWYNPAAFVATPGCASRTDCPADSYGFLPFAPGNSGRNILDGPGKFFINSTLMKNFHLGERRSVQARFEVFNIANHPNFQLPDKSFNKSSAGIISGVQGVGAGGPRTIQVAVKYIF